MTENYPTDGTSSLVASVEPQTLDNLPIKKPRTSEDFYLFCKFILEYENYDRTRRDEEEEYEKTSETEDDAENKTSTESEENSSLVDISSDDSYDLVTCFCQKPFAGRPMIECSSCFTWIHLRCVKIKKSEIPDIFICPSCKKRSKH